MKSKNLFIHVFILILIFLFISVASVSCQITRYGEKDTSETGEAGDMNEAGSQLQEQAGEKSEDETEEITTVNLWISDLIPEYISVEVRNVLSKVFDEIIIADEKENSDVWVEIDISSKESEIRWVLVPVVSFFRSFDDISYENIKEFWAGNKEVLNYISVDDSEPELIVTEEVFKVLEKIFGKSGNENIKVVGKEELLLNIENNNSFSIIPFDDIEKKYKVLNLDEVSVFDKDLDINKYPLAINISVESNNPDFESKIAESFSGVTITNRDMGKLASVIMTGVTAIVRQVARRIESDGVLSPGVEIAEVLRDADITHISNELPFVEGCTGTRPRGLIFCSSPEYIELLRYVGTDVIELTGNHMNDYGHEWMNYTLDMYDEEGWPYFGGGRNLEDSYEPATFEVESNKIAFLGANTFGPASNWATEDTPGSARINVWGEVEKEEDMRKFEAIIEELKKEGYIVIFTFQYEETYSYTPTEVQIADFRRIIDAGADIVSGSQSHYPMGVEFRGDGFINYGLGNLFFGQQLAILGNNPGIIAKHIFYKGKHINTILITTMLNDFSQPRLTTPEERVELLQFIFAGSIR
ncbi:MAG: CapA family protein [Actinobacteria bacterium]|nr:CapA family protein [Actinomycetota bacterium]